MVERNGQGFQAGNSTCKSSPTFARPFVRSQLIARLAGALVTAQCVQTTLLTASTVRLGTLIFLYKNGDNQTIDFFNEGTGTICKPLTDDIQEPMSLQSKNCVRTRRTGPTEDHLISDTVCFFLNLKLKRIIKTQRFFRMEQKNLLKKHGFTCSFHCIVCQVA